MITKEVLIQFKPNENVSPAALVVQKASEYRSQIHFEADSKKVNGKSIMGMLTMPFSAGNKITVIADGEDETDAIAGIAELLTK